MITENIPRISPNRAALLSGRPFLEAQARMIAKAPKSSCFGGEQQARRLHIPAIRLNSGNLVNMEFRLFCDDCSMNFPPV